MSDEDDSCQVQVTGFSEDQTSSEDILLFFESERYCPNGGDVKSIRYLFPNVVVVTFCDSGGKRFSPFFTISILATFKCLIL